MNTTNQFYKTILVGPTGFLGLSFLEYDSDILAVGRTAPGPGFRNSFLKIQDFEDFSILDDIDFDNVVFLIGSSDHEVINNHPTLAFEKNLLPLSSFLWYAKHRTRRPKRIVTFTTMLQYDSDLMALPCSENQPLKPHVNNYVLSKFFAENLSEMYRNYFQIIDIRLSNIYGPTPLRRPDIVPSLVWSLLEDSNTTVRNKTPVRDFVYVEDVLRVVSRLLETNFSGPVNVGSGVGRSVGEMCEILEACSGKVISEIGQPATGHLEYVHDLNLLHSIIGQFVPTSLEDGLSQTYSKMRDASGGWV